MNILLLIFVPKIRFHYFVKENSKSVSTFIGEITGNQEGDGEVILTTQSARTLAKQVTELQKLLREKEQQEMNCNCNRNRMDADPQNNTS